jgi:hypothetical protein
LLLFLSRVSFAQLTSLLLLLPLLLRLLLLRLLLLRLQKLPNLLSLPRRRKPRKPPRKTLLLRLKLLQLHLPPSNSLLTQLKKKPYPKGCGFFMCACARQGAWRESAILSAVVAVR